MSKRSEVKKHIHSLAEIKSIVSAMKNLSLIEINKLNKFIATQDEVVTTIKEAVADFIAFNSFPLFSAPQEPAAGYIIIGSERGFCGNFNEAVIDYFTATIKDQEKITPWLIFIGRKLAAKMAEINYVFKSIDGVNAIEEIPGTILSLVKILAEINQTTGGKIHPGSWAIIYNGEMQNNMQPDSIRPFAEFEQNKVKSFSFAPLLNLKPNEFVAEVLDQYLFAILHQLFYKSFMVENRQRLLHMEGAIRWLEKNSEQLILHYNRLRQEEITEEIEVILLSAQAVIHEMQLEDYD
jgi:F-type H+-transporting ATPase subunit gamma